MLTEAGKPVELGARAFNLLLVLVENHGRLVSKNTLIERVWPRLVVDENNLPAQIASLRRILGAGAIRTVPGYGYRLELAVSARRYRGADAAQMQLPPAVRTAATRHPAASLAERFRPWLGATMTCVGSRRRLAARVSSRSSAAPESASRASPRKYCARGRTGKTRAAAWVSLGSLDNARHIPSTIALALGLSLAGRAGRLYGPASGA